ASFHECGLAALYYLSSDDKSAIVPVGNPNKASRLMYRLLLDIQNRGELTAGMTCYSPDGRQSLDTRKDVGTVSEVFHLNHEEQFQKLMADYSGPAAIGHVRYAQPFKRGDHDNRFSRISDQDGRGYAQPLERHHISKPKWFSFAFIGKLTNHPELRQEILSETDTEILMHLISRELTSPIGNDLLEVLRRVTRRLDGTYNIVYLNSLGQMLVARDPFGSRPMCYATDGPLFVASSESVALTTLGFPPESVHNLASGHAILIRDGQMEIKRFVQ
ncbi:MAG TPA: amidophosphoribosyltransferase, partial [Planctomycetaceae bacterium]|nr:amidophosphoribosyltransferase [Planctomycetaceae bacterium]